MDKLFGLPAHPLMVHVPVVLVPLAALGAVLLVVVPRWRERYEWLVLGAAVVGGVGTQLAVGSGEQLLKRIDTSAAIVKHVDLGRQARLFVALFAVVVLAFVVLTRRARRGHASVGASPRSPVLLNALSALVVVTAVAATVWLVRAGHQGALVTWKGIGPTRG